MKLDLNKVYLGDCIDVIRTFPENSIACCITGPPYNYEFIGHKWNDAEVKRRTERVKNSMAGTMLSEMNGKLLYWCKNV